MKALSNDDLEKIIKALVAGKNIVYCNPTKENFTGFCTVLVLAIDEMRQDGELKDLQQKSKKPSASTNFNSFYAKNCTHIKYNL